MKQGAVLALEVDRQHAGARCLNELCRKHLPRQIFGRSEAHPGGRHAARRKDDDGGAALEQPHRLVPAPDVHRQRLPAFFEGDRQRIRRHLRHLQQVVMDQHPEGAAELFGKRQNGDSVADAEGMVGDDDDRFDRDGFERPIAVDVEFDVNQIEQLAEHTVALADDVAAPEVVEPDEAVAAREPLDRADQPALQARIAIIGIG
ncbi:hypothetical protein ACVITL_002092 [Rhizobium pisi]